MERYVRNRGVFKALPNIYDEALCENNEQLKTVTNFHKRSIISIWLCPKYDSIPYIYFHSLFSIQLIYGIFMIR